MSRLRIRIFLFVLGLCSAVLAATLLLAQHAGQQQRQRSAEREFDVVGQRLQQALDQRQQHQQRAIELLSERPDAGATLDSPEALAELRARLGVDAVALLDERLQPLLYDHGEHGVPPPWSALSPRQRETRWQVDAEGLWLLSQTLLPPNAHNNRLRLGVAARIDDAWLRNWIVDPDIALSLLLRREDGSRILAGTPPADQRSPWLRGERGAGVAAAVTGVETTLDLGAEPQDLIVRWQRRETELPIDYRLLRWQVATMALLVLLCAAIGAVLIGNSITRPLNGLVRHIRRVSAGDMDSTFAADRRGEVAAVAREFAFMLSAIAQREASIRHLAYQDGLTGLANRHRFMEAINECLQAGAELRFVVAVCDLDRFREINDTLGHAAGDRVLKQLALRMQNVTRNGDTLARLSADEFGILMRDVPPTEVIAHLQRYREPFKEPLTVDGIALDMSAAIGAAVHPEHGETAGFLLQRAEIALFQAKLRHTGFALYTPEIDRHTLRRLTLMAELRAAIERNQLELYVQPKLDIRAWKIIGVECLVRWVHPDHGFVPPDEFVPLAEQTGTVRQLTRWILQCALDWALHWKESGFELKVAVNLSTLDLLDPQLAHRTAALLSERGLSFDVLTLEVTESAVMEDPERALPVLSQLRDLGITLSIDDFGTGYSSMAQLKRLPVEELKIDKSFVFDVADNPDDAVIVRSTIDLAHNMELRVVAEGVESERALEWLTHFGCDMAQGYHLSRPIPAADLIPWLESTPYLVARSGAAHSEPPTAGESISLPEAPSLGD